MSAGGGSARHRLTVSDGDARDYDELADDEGDYSTPSGCLKFSLFIKIKDDLFYFIFPLHQCPTTSSRDI